MQAIQEDLVQRSPKVEEEVKWIEGQNNAVNIVDNLSLQLLKDIEVDDEEGVDGLVAMEFDQIIRIASDPFTGDMKGSDEEVVVVKEDKLRKKKSVVSILASPWIAGKEVLSSAMGNTNHQIIQDFLSCVQAHFGRSIVPPEIMAVFEAILSAESQQLVWNDRQNEESDCRFEVRLARKSLWDSRSTAILKNLLLAAVELLAELFDCTSKIKLKMQLDGCLIVGSPEFVLCQRSAHIIQHLVRRLQVLSEVIQRKSFMTDNENEIIRGTEVTFAPWLSKVNQYFQKDIFFSMADELTHVYTLSCDSVIKISARVSFLLEQAKLSQVDPAKIIVITSDIILTMKDVRDNIRSLLGICAHSLSALEIAQLAKFKKPNFSRANKVIRQCDDILKWNADFANHMHTIKTVSSSLALLEDDNRDMDAYTRLIDDLKGLQNSSIFYSITLDRLMKNQAVLVKDLVHSRDPVPTSTPSQTSNCHQRENAIKIDISSIPNDAGHPQLVFGNAEAAEEPATADRGEENKDELYLGLFGNSDDEESAVNPNREYQEEENVAQELYSEVVSQLNSRLAPVKSEMKIREKNAIRKCYGSGFSEEDDGDDADDEATSSSLKSFVDEASPSMKAAEKEVSQNKNDSEAQGEDNDQLASPPNSSFPNTDFLAELRKKLTLDSESPTKLFFLPESAESVTEDGSSSSTSDSEV